MDLEDKRELGGPILQEQDHHELIQQYRKALHLHGDPAQSENESDLDMRNSITLAESSAFSGKAR